MPGPFLPVYSLSRSQSQRIGNAQGGVLGNHVVPQLVQNPSTNPLPQPYLVDLSDGTSRRDLAHHIAIGDLVPATPLRLTNSLGANSAAIAAVATAVNTLALPANIMNVGATFRVTAQGATSATGNLTATTRVGAAGTVADAVVTGTSFAAVAGTTGGGGFVYEAIITVQGVGAGTNGKLMANAQLSAHTNLVYGTANTTQTNVDTTIAEFLTFAIQVSAGTVTVTNSVLEYLGSQF